MMMLLLATTGLIHTLWLPATPLAPQATEVDLFGRSLEIEPVLVDEGAWVLGGDELAAPKGGPLGAVSEPQPARLRLVDRDGLPLTGLSIDARYRVVDVKRNGLRRDLPEFASSGVTDADGVVELAGLGTLLEARFGAGSTAGPLAHSIAEVGLTTTDSSLAAYVFERTDFEAGTAPIEVHLESLRWLEVHFEPVLDAGGLPLEGMRLELEPSIASRTARTFIGSYPVPPGADSMRIGPIPDGGRNWGLGTMHEYWTAVRLMHPDVVGVLRGSVLPALENLEASPDGSYELELPNERELWADRELRLLMLDAEGQPRGAAKFFAMSRWGTSTIFPEYERVASDTASVLALPIPSNAEQRQVTIKCGHCGAQDAYASVEWTDDQLDAGETFEIRIPCACVRVSDERPDTPDPANGADEAAVLEAIAFDGVVLDQTGQPVASASVYIQSPGPDAHSFGLRTDMEGRFTWNRQWADAPTELFVRVEHPDVAPQPSTRLSLPIDSSEPVAFEVVRGARLALVLELDAWVHSDDLWIELRPLDALAKPAKVASIRPDIGESYRPIRGSFEARFQAVPAGSYSLHVAAGEGGDALFEQRVEVDGNRHLGRLDLRGSLEVGVLIGLPEHSPGLELTLVARTGAGQVFEVRSGSASSFERERLLVPAGAVELELVSADGAPSTFSFSQELPRAWFALPRAGQDLPVYPLANR